MKPIVRKLLLGLALVVSIIGLIGGGVYVYRLATIPTLAKSGGTILVYEVDPDVPRLPGGAANYRPEDLAEALKRRVDPIGVYGVTVRPVDPARVEITVPRTSDHAEYLQQIKDLVAAQGRLEFCVVANRHNDGPAFKAAEDYFQSNANAAQRKQDLQRAAEAGLPPPMPFVADDDNKTTYSWVELGRTERATLGLGNAAKVSPRWFDAAEARERGVPLVIELPAGDGRTGATNGSMTMLVWSRKCENVRLSVDERKLKEFDYFMLVRNPASPDRAVTGNDLINAAVNDASPNNPSIEFTFNAAGGRLFGQLTSENLPVGKEPSLQYSAVCIILDGQIMTAPSLNSPIYDRGAIDGKFTPEEAKRLAQILRAGALPVTLKPLPISEITVEKK